MNDDNIELDLLVRNFYQACYDANINKIAFYINKIAEHADRPTFIQEILTTGMGSVAVTLQEAGGCTTQSEVAEKWREISAHITEGMNG